MSLLQYSIGFLVSNLCHVVVQPLFCNHSNYTVSTNRTNHEEVQLLLNCSSNYLSVATFFNVPSDSLLEYIILYTCTHRDHPRPIQHVAIAHAIANKKISLDEIIPCGSLCTFGGCYSSGPLGRVVDHLISPLQSCYVCNGGKSGACMIQNDRSCNGNDTQCIPSLNLGNGTVQCDCSFEEECATSNSAALPTSTTTVSEGTPSGVGECTCICTALAEGYKCTCSGVQLDIPCSDTSGCELYYCDATVNTCEDIEHGGNCFCSERNGYNCTSRKSSAPIDAIVTSILAVSVLFISLTTICVIVILYSISSKSRKKRVKRPVFIDSTRFDEISTFDPVDITAPFDEARFGSFSTLLHSFDVLSSVNLNQSRSTSSQSSSADSCMDSECHLSDAEGYVVSQDCPCFSDSSEIKTCKTCHHCKMNKDEQNIIITP